MIITSLPYRTAIVQELDGQVEFSTVTLRVFEEYLMETPTKTRSTLPDGTEVYIVVLNQTSNESNSGKCNRNNSDSIQIQVNTVFPAGKGGSKTAEQIANSILAILFPNNSKQAELNMPDNLNMWRSKLIGTRNINYDSDSHRTWTTQLILESWISQQ